MRPAVILTLPVQPELKDAIGTAADAKGMPMNEFVAEVLAQYLGRPELAAIPRKAFGRPRKPAVPTN